MADRRGKVRATAGVLVALALFFSVDILPGDGVHGTLGTGGGQSVPMTSVDTRRIADYLLVGVVLIGALSLIWVGRGPSPRPSEAQGTGKRSFDLLRIKPFARLVRLKYFRLSLQLINVAVFLGLIYFGFYGVQSPTQSVTYSLTWYFWWPVFFLLILFLGRIWCMVCPFAALADWMQRVLNFNLKFPKRLRNLWPATGMFVLLHFAYVWWISGSPWLTSLAVVIGFIAPAIVVSVLYQRRNFCQYVCPLGGLLTVYSLISPIQLGNRSDEVCKGCKTKDCYKGNERGEGCPVNAVVTNIERTGDCLLCMECVKTCRNDNVELKVRTFGTDLWNTKKRTLDESTIGVLMVGLVVTKTAIMLEPWERFVQWFAAPFGLSLEVAANILFVGLTVVLPVALTCVAIGLAMLYMGRKLGGFWDLYRILGYMLVPVALALQIAHELDHLLNDGPYALTAIGMLLAPVIPLFRGLAGLSLGSSVSPDFLFFIKILIPIAGLAFALFVGHRMASRLYVTQKTFKAGIVPMYGLTIAFTMVSVYLMGFPMMGH